MIGLAPSQQDVPHREVGQRWFWTWQIQKKMTEAAKIQSTKLCCNFCSWKATTNSNAGSSKSIAKEPLMTNQLHQRLHVFRLGAPSQTKICPDTEWNHHCCDNEIIIVDNEWLRSNLVDPFPRLNPRLKGRIQCGPVVNLVAYCCLGSKNFIGSATKMDKKHELWQRHPGCSG